VTPSGAEAKRIGEEIEVYCKKCWGELGLNRASVALKKSADASSDASGYVADEPAVSEEQPVAEVAKAEEPEQPTD